MSEQAASLRDEPLTSVMTGLRDALVGLAIGLAALAVLFHTESAVAVKIWIDSTAYNHCFLVIPIVLYLIWDRRPSLRGLHAEPLPLVALLTLPLGVVWLAAERLGIMEGRQLIALTMVEVLFLAMLGWRLWRALLGPLLYLYFLVPFGEFLTPKLQDITTWFVRQGVDVLGIPAYIDGYIIEIPEGSFFVAEACAGLRFLIASIAFGVLYAIMMYRSPVRRIIFIAVSIVIPIIANGFRALGIVELGHILGNAEAAAADHVLYGWIFFSIVILLLIAVGLPFRQDDRPEEAAPLGTAAKVNSAGQADPGAARRGLFAGLGVAVLASLGPVIVLALSHASAAPDVALNPLDLSPSCVNQGPPTIPDSESPGRAIVQRIRCGGTEMIVQLEVFAPRSTAGPINAERRRLTRPQEADDIAESPLMTRGGGSLPPWRLVRANEPAFIAAAGVWIDGEPTTPGLAMRLRMARTSVTGGTLAPVVVAIRPMVDWRRVDMVRKQALERQLAELLDARPDIEEQVRKVAKAGR
jgi:exosortase A